MYQVERLHVSGGLFNGFFSHIHHIVKFVVFNQTLTIFYYDNFEVPAPIGIQKLDLNCRKTTFKNKTVQGLCGHFRL